MPPDVPDLPEKFARLQQQLVLTEVELMKLEDLRDELRTREAAAQSLVRDLQGIADGAVAARDQSAARAAEQEDALGQLQAQLVAAQAQIEQLNARAVSLARDAGLERSRADQLAATLAALESSASWRWTSPLRAIGRLFGRRP